MNGKLEWLKGILENHLVKDIKPNSKICFKYIRKPTGGQVGVVEHQGIKETITEDKEITEKLNE